MQNITKTVENFLRREGIRFKPDGHTGVLKTGFAGHNGCFLGYVAIDEENRNILIDTIAPIKAPRDKRLKAAELIARLNRPLLIGNFNLNMGTGLIAYKTSVVLGDSDLHSDIIEHLLFANWLAMDRYFPAFNLVILCNVQPKKAIEMIKKSRGSVSDTVDADNDAETPKIPSLWLRNIMGGSIN